MAKAYWISAHRKVNDAAKVAAYAALAKPILQSHGGRYLTSDVAAHVYEAGIKARVVIIEFETVAAAIAAHEFGRISERSSSPGWWLRARSPNC